MTRPDNKTPTTKPKGAFVHRLSQDAKQCSVILKKLLRVLRQEGLSGLNRRIHALESEAYLDYVGSYSGFSIHFLQKIQKLSKIITYLKRKWLADQRRQELSLRVMRFLQGETVAPIILKEHNILLSIDHPKIRCIMASRGHSTLSGWAFQAPARPIGIRVKLGKKIFHANPLIRTDVAKTFNLAGDKSAEVGFTIPLHFSRLCCIAKVELEITSNQWIPIRRTLFIRAPKIRSLLKKRPMPYQAWIRAYDKKMQAEMAEMQQHMKIMIFKPKFNIILDLRKKQADFKKTLDSIYCQTYPYWDIQILTSQEELPLKITKDIALRQCPAELDLQGDFFIWLEAGQKLAPHALYEFANAINQYPEANLIYGDEDHYSAWGRRCNPFYKPGWSPDYLETFNYIGFTACLRSNLLKDQPKNNLYDLLLRLTELNAEVVHLKKILGHSPITTRETMPEEISALEGRLLRTKRKGAVIPNSQHPGCYTVNITLSDTPLVSIIIPTAGKTVSVNGKNIDLLSNVINEILEKSTYRKFEIIIIDNNDLTESQRILLKEKSCRRITYTEKEFNISKKLNLGAKFARGEIFILMNDDIEILSPDWIENMLEQFEKPHVGIVGAKLLYPEGLIQHAGVVHNHGNPDHVRKKMPSTDAGYFFSSCGTRNYSAVTGACMMTRADIYRSVGGYSEELAVSFNDVDFCLKVRKNNLSVVYAPKVVLTHMESLSRIPTLNLKELHWYHHRWAGTLVFDEFYNERFLQIAPPTFTPHINVRVL